jgi:hypothetical protein
MINWTERKQRHLRNDLPIRLGGIVANLARIKSFCEDVENQILVESIIQSFQSIAATQRLSSSEYCTTPSTSNSSL